MKKLSEYISASSIASKSERLGRSEADAASRLKDTHTKDHKDKQIHAIASRELDKARVLMKKKKKGNSLLGKAANLFRKLKPIKEYYRIDESFDMNDIVSRLKGIEAKGYDYSDTVTYGVEDEKGNIMKITVKSEQSADFEQEMGQQLAQVEKFKKTGYEGMDTSLAELVYNLRGKFEIINLEFPTIPSDVIYNADNATSSDQLKPRGAAPDDFDQFSSNQYELGAENDNPDPFGDPSMGDGMDNSMGGGSDMGQDPNSQDSNGEFGDDGSFPEGDAESVEDFEEPVGGSSPEQLLQNVLDMLIAQANAQTAQANAQAEESRAKQAEYTAKATESTIASQQEMMRMEVELDEQKRKEKEAKKLADIARYRVEKSAIASAPEVPMGGSNSTFESFDISLAQLNEVDQFATVQSLGRERSSIMLMYQIQPTDDAETKKYKTLMKNEALRELNVKMRQAQLMATFKNVQNAKQAELAKQQNPNQQQNQQNNQQQQVNNQMPNAGNTSNNRSVGI